MAGGAIAAATAFNLLCVGGWTITVPPGEPRSGDSSWTYRVDLEKMRWCLGQCAVSRPLYGVSETEIVFEFLNSDGLEVRHSVNRESGRMVHQRVLTSPQFQVVSTAQCERAPFTGLPEG